MRNFRNQTTKNRHTGDRLEQIHGTYSALNNKALSVKKEEFGYLGLQKITRLLKMQF